MDPQSDSKEDIVLSSSLPWGLRGRLAILDHGPGSLAGGTAHRRLCALLAMGLRRHESDLGELRRCDHFGFPPAFHYACTVTGAANDDLDAGAYAIARAAGACADASGAGAASATNVLLEQVGGCVKLRLLPRKRRAVQHGLEPDVQLRHRLQAVVRVDSVGVGTSRRGSVFFSVELTAHRYFGESPGARLAFL